MLILNKITTNLMGYYANIPKPIWSNPQVIANILSLARLKQYYHITYGNFSSDRFILTLNDNTKIHFKPSHASLYYINLSSDGSHAHVERTGQTAYSVELLGMSAGAHSRPGKILQYDWLLIERSQNYDPNRAAIYVDGEPAWSTCNN